jgi:preprotein translocase subunit YajC
MLLAEDGAKTPPAGLDPIMMILAMAIPFILLIVLPARKEKKQRQQMLAAVDKGDKVVVSGAILGTVVQVDKGDEKDPEDKLVIKIDENANIKMRVLRSSVTRVTKKDTSKDGA